MWLSRSWAVGLIVSVRHRLVSLRPLLVLEPWRPRARVPVKMTWQHMPAETLDAPRAPRPIQILNCAYQPPAEKGSFFANPTP